MATVSTKLTKKTKTPDDLTTKIVKAANKRLDNFVKKGSSEVRAALPVDTGRLRRSVKGSISTAKGVLEAKITMADYVLPLEIGLPVGTKTTDIVALAKWALRKGITNDANQAGRIAKYIAARWAARGRSAKGFLGLAAPGAAGIAIPDIELTPLPGTVLARVFKELEADLAIFEKDLFS